MSQSNSQRQIRILATLLFAFVIGALLYGCGGGGGGGGSSAPTDLTLAVQQTKLFHFTWPDASDETSYQLSEDPDSSSGYTVIATLPANTTSYEHTVFLPERVNARYILEKCVSGTCSQYLSTVNVSGNLAEGVGYFKGSNTDTNDLFGHSVALSADGSTMAVGAMWEGANSSGAVYVFKKSGNAWTQTAYLKASNAGDQDEFGISVALSSDGSVLAVGADEEDSNGTSQTDNSTGNSGAVYLFSNSGGTWAQTDYIKASSPVLGDQFGFSVALSATGTTLAVGANQQGVGDGAVYLFSNSSGWAQVGSPITASNAEANDNFGYAIALSADGSTLAVGAYQEDGSATVINGADNNSATDSGAVYLFTSGSGWAQDAYIKASNTAAGDHFGRSVALSQDGSILAAGSTVQGGAGAVYLFSNSGGWQEDTYFSASNTGSGDQFGISVSLSADGSVLAVGAHGEDSSATGINGDGADDSASVSGAAYIFSNGSGSWTQRAYIKAPNAETPDRFGMAIALESDGSMLAVGAEDEKSNATGINGDQTDNSAGFAGAVYLY